MPPVERPQRRLHGRNMQRKRSEGDTGPATLGTTARAHLLLRVWCKDLPAPGRSRPRRAGGALWHRSGSAGLGQETRLLQVQQPERWLHRCAAGYRLARGSRVMRPLRLAVARAVMLHGKRKPHRSGASLGRSRPKWARRLPPPRKAATERRDQHKPDCRALSGVIEKTIYKWVKWAVPT